ncbi:MAG: alpha-L-fucosidase, partial [Oscillospiraceae bacterium]
AECDCMMRERQWFCSDSDVDTIKSVDELVGMYESSVGRGANLLLNIGPDCNGELPIPDATRLLEFGREIKRRYESPIATMTDCEMEMEKHTLVNQVVLCEDLSNGEHIEEFEIWADIYLGKTAFLIYKGDTVGHKRICKFPVMKTNHINIKVTKASGDYVFNEGTAFYVK